MCGLYGHLLREEYIQKHLDPIKYAAMMSILAVSMDNRGGDSWGKAEWKNPTNWKDVELKKGLGDAGVNISERFSNISPIVIAHTRKATTGAKTVENSHPFKIGKIVGAHNGIVSNYDEIRKDYSVHFEVDSEAIFHVLDKGDSFSKLRAFGAITYADLELPGKVWLAKFNSGQLGLYGLGKVGNCGGMVWASTDAPIEAALLAAGISEYFKFRVEEDKLYYISEDGFYVDPEKIDIKRNSYGSSNYSSVGYTPTTSQNGGYKPPNPAVCRTLGSGENDDEKKSESIQTVAGFGTRDILSVIVEQLGLASRIADEFPTAQQVRVKGNNNSRCDWCETDEWEYFCKTSRAYFCTGCWGDYLGMVVDGETITYKWMMWHNCLSKNEIYSEAIDGKLLSIAAH